MSNYLHIYGQSEWHGDAFIVANKEALIDLKEAIEKALENDSGSLNAFVNDGEGFYTAIVKIDNQEEFDKLANPYTSEIAEDKDEDSIWPWKLELAKKEIQFQYDKHREEK